MSRLRTWWNTARDWLLAFLFVFSILLGQGFLSQRDEAAGLRIKLVDTTTQLVNRGIECPPYFDGLPLSFDAKEPMNLSRPGYARISCYYKKPTNS